MELARRNRPGHRASRVIRDLPATLTLLQLFEEKIGNLRETLDAEIVRGEAAEILSTLIESVTIYPDDEHGAEAKVVARISDL